jgi:hypothetical protein
MVSLAGTRKGKILKNKKRESRRSPLGSHGHVRHLEYRCELGRGVFDEVLLRPAVHSTFAIKYNRVHADHALEAGFIFELKGCL